MIVITMPVIITTVLLVLATGLFCYVFAKHFQARKLLRDGLNRLNEEYNERRLQREVHKYYRSVSVKLNFAEKIELRYIDKSNIRRYIPFINIYTLLLFCGIIFALAFGPVMEIFRFVPSAAVICIIISSAPFFALDIMGMRNSDVIRKMLAEYISILNRWCQVKEDIFYAFEMSLTSGINDPMKTFIRDMVIQFKRGINPLEALEILRMKVDNPQFTDFIVNIKQNVKSRGDTLKLLSNLESQFYKIEEEYNRRKIFTYKDRLFIYCVMFGVLIVGYFFIKSSPKIESYYLSTLSGQGLMLLFCVLYALGVFFTTRISMFRY